MKIYSKRLSQIPELLILETPFLFDFSTKFFPFRTNSKYGPGLQADYSTKKRRIRPSLQYK